MPSGMCIQLRHVIDMTLPPDLSLVHARTPLANLPSHRRLRFIRCGSRRAGFPACRLLLARCPLDVIVMMAVLRRAMSMKHISVYLLFAAAIQGLCSADVTKLAADDRKVLGDASRFHEVHTTSDLPSAIVAGDGGKIAEPGQKWNATDAIIDPTLPGKRLIWGAVGDDYYVVHYERGGIAHTFHILVAKLAKNDAKPKVVWVGAGGPFKDYAGFLDALRSGKLDDRLDYAH